MNQESMNGWVLVALKAAATLTLLNVKVQSSGGMGGKLPPYKS